MKILIEQGGGAHKFERMGLARAFQYSGHEVIIWNPEGKSPYDQVDEFQPSLFIGNGFDLSESLINALSENNNTKAWLKLGDYGPINKFYTEKHQVLVASEESKEKVKRLASKIEVFGGAHYWIGRQEDSHGFWREQGVTPLHSTLGCDVFNYTNGIEKPEYKSDIGICSGFWKYKGASIESWLFPLMRPDSKLNIKVFGYGWPTHYYCGPIEEENEKHFLKSCSICINIHEKQATDDTLGFELNERSFKLLSNKCFVVSDRPADLANEIFNNREIVFAKNPAEFKSLIEHYLKYPEEKTEVIDRGYQKVIKSESYFSRAAYLMKNLFGESEEKQILDSYEKVKLELRL